MRKKIKLKNTDFYISIGKNVNPLKKVSGTYYLYQDKPVNGHYWISKKKYLNTTKCDDSSGFVKVEDVDKERILLTL